MTISADFVQQHKYNMEQDYKTHKLYIDRKLANDLKAIGFIRAEQDISVLCGKERSYFSSMRAKGYGLHLGSLTLLAARIAARMNEESDLRERANLRMALAAVNEAIQAKCRLREQELLAQ